MVAADHGQNHLVIQFIDDRLHGLFNGRMEEIADHFNGMLSWCFYDFLFLIIFNAAGNGIRFYRFNVSRKIAVFAVYDIRFAGVRKDFEFMGSIAADGTGVSDDGAEVQSAAGKDAGVGIIHELVLFIEAFLVSIKGIAIFHNEFAASHEAETGPLFISVFILDLVYGNRKLLVGCGIHGNQGGHQFFMGRSKAVIPAMAVLQLEHFFSVHSPAAGFLPDFRRLHNGHQDFLGTGLIDFLPNDFFYFLDRAECQRQVSVGAIGNFSHHACLQHVFMAHYHRVGR